MPDAFRTFQYILSSTLARAFRLLSLSISVLETPEIQITLAFHLLKSSGNTVSQGIYLVMIESEDIETFTAKVVVR